MGRVRCRQEGSRIQWLAISCALHVDAPMTDKPKPTLRDIDHAFSDLLHSKKNERGNIEIMDFKLIELWKLCKDAASQP